MQYTNHVTLEGTVAPGSIRCEKKSAAMTSLHFTLCTRERWGKSGAKNDHVEYHPVVLRDCKGYRMYTRYGRFILPRAPLMIVGKLRHKAVAFGERRGSMSQIDCQFVHSLKDGGAPGLAERPLPKALRRGASDRQELNARTAAGAQCGVYDEAETDRGSFVSFLERLPYPLNNAMLKNAQDYRSYERAINDGSLDPTSLGIGSQRWLQQANDARLIAELSRCNQYFLYELAGELGMTLNFHQGFVSDSERKKHEELLYEYQMRRLPRGYAAEHNEALLDLPKGWAAVSPQVTAKAEPLTASTSSQPSAETDPLSGIRTVVRAEDDLTELYTAAEKAAQEERAESAGAPEAVAAKLQSSQVESRAPDAKPDNAPAAEQVPAPQKAKDREPTKYQIPWWMLGLDEIQSLINEGIDPYAKSKPGHNGFILPGDMPKEGQAA